MTRTSVSSQQERAWSFYGYPNSRGRAVGEVRYVVGWLADQMSRLEWDVTIGGSENWTVTTPAGEFITTKNAAGEDDLTAASGELLDVISWSDSNVRSITTNLFVAGQGDYVNDPPDVKEADTVTGDWRVLSVIEKDRKKVLDRANERVPFLWPHPADPTKPDAPLFSVLELLDELDWLNRQARTQSRQRVLISGILGISDGFEGPPKNDGTPSTFWDQWNEMISAHMDDPDDMSPIRLTGPVDANGVNLVKDGINWVVPNFGYDDVLDRRVLAAINRLAYGLPVPPEILLGMQAQSRATAFQVEENAYRAHIEPPAWMVAQVAEDALRKILDNPKVEVIPNPTQLLARRNSVEDVKWAFMNGLADGPFTREVLSIPEDEAPKAEVQQSAAVTTAIDLVKTLPTLARNPGLDVLVEQISKLLEGTPSPELGDSVAAADKDPANVAADEPVTAAARTQDDLGVLLADIDFHLASELAGVTVMAVDRARQRLGAAARSTESVRANPELKGLSNTELATKLGMDGLIAAGVNVADQLADPIDAASRWWVRRVGEVWNQMGTLVPGWTGQDAWKTESSAQLVASLATHVVDTLTETDPGPLDAADIRTVLDLASGGN